VKARGAPATERAKVMRSSKGFVPAGAELSDKDDATFERIATLDLERRAREVEIAKRNGNTIRPALLDPGLAFWRWLPKAYPQTRRRLIARCLRLSTSACVPASEKLIRLIEHEFKTSASPRARVRKPDEMRRAAHHLVRHPGASYSKIAEAMGSTGKKTTAELYLARDDFWNLCAEEMLLHDRSRQYAILADYEKRFGQLDDGAPDFFHRDGDVPLCYLVPLMLDAIDGKRGPLDRSSVESAEAAYKNLMTRESLQARLRPS
jgi:hypothetical protein